MARLAGQVAEGVAEDSLAFAGKHALQRPGFQLVPEMQQVPGEWAGYSKKKR